jgi:methyltransferase (TIGR00027 family)
LEDELGLRLADPEGNWRERPDMNPHGTQTFRASIVARARFIEDLVGEQAGLGVDQYVILGAGLDTFAQRQPDVAARLTVFEVDQAATQSWKRQRLLELGLQVPPGLRFVPVDFEAGSWLDQVKAAGFDAARPAVVASTGVTMYLTKAAIADTLRQIATLARGSTLAMTFLLPLEFAAPEERAAFAAAKQGAKRSGTPFVSLFTPSDMMDMARVAGFRHVDYVSGAMLAERYFANRSDGLHPGGSEAILVAET